MAGEVYQRVYALVQQIPKGKVLTYGMVSHLLAGRLSAQGVGWALAALPHASKEKYHVNNVPWHRVINAAGRLSTYKNPDIPPDLQQRLLEKEGIVFDDSGALDLQKHLWADVSSKIKL
jgi:methylated-DNA-protein-cysteine methyltransferase-like protein